MFRLRPRPHNSHRHRLLEAVNAAIRRRRMGPAVCHRNLCGRQALRDCRRLTGRLGRRDLCPTVHRGPGGRCLMGRPARQLNRRHRRLKSM